MSELESVSASLFKELRDRATELSAQCEGYRVRLQEAVRAIDAKEEEQRSLRHELFRLKEIIADTGGKQEMQALIERCKCLEAISDAYRDIAVGFQVILANERVLRKLPSWEKKENDA